MPHVQPGSGFKNRDQRTEFKERAKRSSLARDNLDPALAGQENRGPSGAPKDPEPTHSHHTRRKSRNSSHKDERDRNEERDGLRMSGKAYEEPKK